MALSIEKYNLGFMAAGLGTAHLVGLARLFGVIGCWDKTAAKAMKENTFQQPRKSSSVRLFREFRTRFQSLTEDQIQILLGPDSIDRNRIALFAVFKSYPFIADFSAEVLLPKVDRFDFELRPSDYSLFIEEKEDLHPELVKLTDSSSHKVRQVTMRILMEGELLSTSKPTTITP